MMSNFTVTITESNLSMLWARAFMAILNRPHSSLMPMTLHLDSFSGSPPEIREMRDVVNECLAAHNYSRQKEGGKSRNYFYSIEKTAQTIFPQKYWKLYRSPGVEDFRDLYINEIFPRLVQLDSRNRTGTYFQRMIAYGATIEKDGTISGTPINQLDNIVTSWKKNVHRASAMQATISDPNIDQRLTSNGCLPIYAQFPCLQQVGFVSDGSGGIGVVAYYPSEFILFRGYGNYLGLAQLGSYMAQQMGAMRTSMTCFIGHPILNPSKTSLRGLESQLQELVGIEEARRESKGLDPLTGLAK